MKRIILVLVMVFPVFGMANDQKKVKSSIKQVTVFLQRAQVERSTNLTVPVGVTEVVLEGLSHSIDPASIQVTGKGSFIILGVKHQSNYLDENVMPKPLKVLTDSLVYYSNQLVFKKNSREVLNKEEALLLANQKIGGGQQNLTATQLKDMADFFRSRMNDISLEKIEVEEDIKVLNMRINATKNQINEMRSGWVRQTGEIVVTLSAKESVKAKLDFTYVVRNAGWYPSYDLRATSIDAPILLGYKANVYQNSGVTWNDVKLVLSTANPTQGGQKPYLSSWYLDFYNPNPYRSAVGAVTRSAPVEDDFGFADEKEAGWGDEEEDVWTEAEVAEEVSDYTEVIQTSLNTQFDIALRYTVPTGGKPELVDIQEHQLNATYRYSAAPKLDKDAFLLASITGWEDLSLLPGEASVYFEGTFINNTQIDPVNTKDTLDLSLGRDKRIVVDRKKVTDFTSKKTIGGKIKELYKYEIEVRNTKSKAITISLEDQLPLTRNKNIQIEIISDGGADHDINTGKLTWNMELDPKGSKKVSFEFEVTYPKDKVVSGL